MDSIVFILDFCTSCVDTGPTGAYGRLLESYFFKRPEVELHVVFSPSSPILSCITIYVVLGTCVFFLTLFMAF